MVNKLQSGKTKTVYLFDFQDDLLLKVINRILTENFGFPISELYHSFQKRKGTKTVFKSIVKDIELYSKHCLKTDISNFFNSINTKDFIQTLPDEIKQDQILYKLLKQLILNEKAILANKEIIIEPKGLMAGSPVSPFLSNIYLKSLDDYFSKNNNTYARYLDDIIIFDYARKIEHHKAYIEKYLEDKKLVVNKDKTSFGSPGEMNIFLVFHTKKELLTYLPFRF